MPAKPNQPGSASAGPQPNADPPAPAAAPDARPPLHPQITGLTFLTELVVPGSSHLLAGKWRKGLGYAVAGGVVGAAAGFPATVLVSATSFTHAVTGQDPLGLGKLRGSLATAVAPSEPQPDPAT
jgi:hypothetical protein